MCIRYVVVIWECAAWHRPSLHTSVAIFYVLRGQCVNYSANSSAHPTSEGSPPEQLTANHHDRLLRGIEYLDTPGYNPVAWAKWIPVLFWDRSYLWILIDRSGDYNISWIITTCWLSSRLDFNLFHEQNMYKDSNELVRTMNNKAIRDGRPRPPRHQGFIAISYGGSELRHRSILETITHRPKCHIQKL